MRKLIPKYQVPAGTLPPKQYGTTLTGPTTTAFDKRIRYQPSLNSLVSKQSADALTKILQPRTIDPSLMGPQSRKKSGEGLFANLKGSGLGKSIASGMADSITPLGSSVIQGMGGEAAETMGGAEQAIIGVGGAVDKIGSLGIKSGNPILMAAGLAAKGLVLLNTFGGNENKEQGTKGIDTGSYTAEVSQNAGMKNSLIGSIGFGKKKKNKKAKADALTAKTDSMNLRANQAAFGNTQNMTMAQNMYGTIADKNLQQQMGGIGTYAVSAKKGAKINPKQLSNIKNKAIRKVRKAQEGTPTDDMQKMSLGGTLNIIPEGALHARKNNYEGELGEQVTSKGIPVITYEEDGKITQHAEIEHSEIIFNKEVTIQLEKWEKEYRDCEDSKRKAELELECGKFLTTEILENTEDNVGLIETIE